MPGVDDIEGSGDTTVIPLESEMYAQVNIEAGVGALLEI